MSMNPGMKMMMLNKVMPKTEDRRSEYGGGNRRMIGYDRDSETENRRRYAEGNRMAYDMDEPEARRRRDSRGRYMTGRMEDDDEEIEMRGQRWYPPVGRMPPSMHGGYGDIYAEGTIYAPGTMNRPMHGGVEQEWTKPVDEHTARMWVSKMDGGEHFNMQTAQQHRAICPECDPVEWYVAMNAMYSDHCETAKKMGMDKPEFYAHMAKDFLMDRDAKPHKLRRYMEHIAK